MDVDPQAVAARLPDLADVSEVWRLAQRRLRSGDAAFVAELGIALWQRYGQQPAVPWQYRSVSDRILRLLCLHPGALTEAVRLTAATAQGRQIRYAASLLASAHTPAALDQIVAGEAGATELRACLLQELVLRGAAVREPSGQDHPLAWLPPALTPLEGRPVLPRYTMDGTSYAHPGIAVKPGNGGGPVPRARETTTEAAAAAIGAAVANWAGESNGRVEARTFALDADLHPDALGATLLSLGLDSVPSLTQEPGACTPAQAWQELFAAASTGGAYSSGDFGAYGRLFAWRSVAALAGAPADASPAGVEALAGACAWSSFAGANRWFDNVAWDIGLVAVTPDRRRVAVLAASDTD
jgi:hypothetical protein